MESYKSEIVILNFDLKSNQAAIKIKTPFFMLEMLSPMLVKAGIFDEYKISNPTTIQFPEFNALSFKEEYLKSISNFPQHMNELLKIKVKALVEAYNEINITLKDPTVLTPLLPMSVMVEIRYRFNISELKDVIEVLKTTSHPALVDFTNGLVALIKELEKSLS